MSIAHPSQINLCGIMWGLWTLWGRPLWSAKSVGPITISGSNQPAIFLRSRAPTQAHAPNIAMTGIRSINKNALSTVILEASSAGNSAKPTHAPATVATRPAGTIEKTFLVLPTVAYASGKEATPMMLPIWSDAVGE